jgi:hypothetical protein
MTDPEAVILPLPVLRPRHRVDTDHQHVSVP